MLNVNTERNTRMHAAALWSARDLSPLSLYRNVLPYWNRESGDKSRALQRAATTGGTSRTPILYYYMTELSVRGHGDRLKVTACTVCPLPCAVGRGTAYR